MVLEAKRLTVTEFDAFVQLPSNEDKLFEYIGGEIVEVPSNPYSSKIAFEIGRLIANFVADHNLGHITGEAGGYEVSGERYAPDVAFVSYETQKELDISGYNSIAPDLAVEVISSGSKSELHRLRIKIGNYLAAGTIVWVINTEDKKIEIHESNQPVVVLNEDDTLTAKGVLDGFSLSIKQIFKP